MNGSRTLRSIAAVSLLIGTLTLTSSRAHALGEKSYVSFAPTPDAFTLSTPTVSAPIYVDNVDWPGVQRAAFNLASDIAQVTGRSPELIHQNLTGGESIVLIGTIGHSPLIDKLIAETQARRLRHHGPLGDRRHRDHHQPLPRHPLRTRYRRGGQARDHLRYLRPLGADRSLPVGLVGRRANPPSGRPVRRCRSHRAARAARPLPRYLSQRRSPCADRLGQREIRRLQPSLLRARLRAPPSPQSELPMACHVELGLRRRRSYQRRARRRVRHRHEHLARRTDDARRKGVDSRQLWRLGLHHQRQSHRRLLARRYAP